MTSTPPKRIVILPLAEGHVVARYTELGKPIGEFYQISDGKIRFSYLQGKSRRWYVNKSLTAFREAANVFNRFCALHAHDDDTDNVITWSLLAGQLTRELEAIEPLGDPETSLWSTTIHDTEWGLLSLR
jgi:hypothetical protein